MTQKEDSIRIPCRIESLVLATNQQYTLFTRGQHLLVAVSGGADSIALLHILHQLSKSWDLRLTVAHVHHGLRANSADQDAQFTRQFTEQLKIPFKILNAPVRQIARDNKISLEMAGRRARYDFFARLAQQLPCDAIATAHTANDQAETILLSLARGTGLAGLAGIPYQTFWKNQKIIRPFLDLQRAEIIHYLKTHDLTWREDESNRDSGFLRNKVRCHILPYLRKNLNPRLTEALLRNAEISRMDNQWLDQLTHDLLQECMLTVPCNALDVTKLRTLPLAAQRRILLLWLRVNNIPHEKINFARIERIRVMLPASHAKSLSLSRQYELHCAKNLLWITGKDQENTRSFCWGIPTPGQRDLPEIGVKVTAQLGCGRLPDLARGIGTYPAQAALAVAAWKQRAIYIRSWQAGDRMRPLGMAGSKKVQDIFTDAKITRSARAKIPLVLCGDEIIWIPGYQIARGWEITAEDTPALHLALKKCP